MADPKDETYSEEETERRAAAALKHMLNSPPKPHKRMAPGKPTKPSK